MQEAGSAGDTGGPERDRGGPVCTDVVGATRRCETETRPGDKGYRRVDLHKRVALGSAQGSSPGETVCMCMCVA